MTRRTASRALGAAAAGVLAVGLLSGCASGYNAATQDVQAPDEGNNGMAGAIAVRNSLLVTVPSGAEDALVLTSFVNEGSSTDALESVQLGDGPAVTVPGGRQLPPNQLVQYGPSDAPGAVSAGSLVVTGSGPVVAGDVVPVTYDFQYAGRVTVQTVVVDPTGVYSSATPAPSSAEPTPVSSAGVGGSATPTPSSTESAATEPAPVPTDNTSTVSPTPNP